MKKPVEYFDTDFLDNKIEIGNRVILEEPKYRNFIIGTVITKAPKSCQIEYVDFLGDKKVARQYYGQIIKYSSRIGTWLMKDDGRAHCSECDTPGMAYAWKYCPNCGAEMTRG